MMFGFMELFDMVVMTVAVGYIFMDSLSDGSRPILMYGFDWARFRLACIVAAPAIVLHELGHKFAAVWAGLSATLHADYAWLLVGAVLKMLNTGLVFFVPGYVSLYGTLSPLASAGVAFAGPAANLLLWGGSKAVLKAVPRMKIGTYRILSMTRQINGFLFVLNMLPIFMFDGHKVFSGLAGWLWP